MSYVLVAAIILDIDLSSIDVDDISRVPTHSFATGQYISTFIVNKIGGQWHGTIDVGRGEMLFKMMKCAGFLVISLSCGYLVVIV